MDAERGGRAAHRRADAVEAQRSLGQPTRRPGRSRLSAPTKGSMIGIEMPVEGDTASAARAERGAHERHGRVNIPEHERLLEPEHAIAEPSEHAVPAGVGRGAPRVPAAIDLDDQACSGSPTFPRQK
jgi:hypothetical protein